MLDIKQTGADSVDRFIKALICGDPGAGKTLISSTFPDPFYLTTEGLMMSVADRNVRYHKLKSMDELQVAIKMLQQTPRVRAQQFGFPVQTVIIDTIDDVSLMLLKQRCREEGHDHASLQDYGWLKDQMVGIVSALRNLDMNVVMTCHLKSRDINGLQSFIPAIEGGFSEKIAGYVDLSLILRTKEVTKVIGKDAVKDIERYLQTRQDPRHTFVKDHSGKLPIEFPVNFEDDYDRLATIIYGAPQEIVISDEPEEIEEPAVSEPETVPAQEGELPLNEALETTVEAPDVTEESEPRFECTECGTKFDDEDQHDRCKIKGWPVLCKPCAKTLK